MSEYSGITALDMREVAWFLGSRSGYLMDLEDATDSKTPLIALELFFAKGMKQFNEIMTDPRMDVPSWDDPRISTAGPFVFPAESANAFLQDIFESVSEAIKKLPKPPTLTI